MLAAEFRITTTLDASLVATIRGGAVVQAAPAGGNRHVLARVAAAWASGRGACAVEVAKARGRGVRLGVAGAGDLGGTVGC